MLDIDEVAEVARLNGYCERNMPSPVELAAILAGKATDGDLELMLQIEVDEHGEVHIR